MSQNSSPNVSFKATQQLITQGLPSSVQGLELRAGHDLVVTIDVLVVGTVEPSHLIVETSDKVNDQGNAAGLG